MSIEFTADSQVIRADPTAASISHDAFTLTARVKMGSDAGTNNVINVETAASQLIQLYTTGGVTAWRVGHNYKGSNSAIGTGAADEWISIAVVGAVNGSSQRVLRGYLRNAEGATQSVELVHGRQTTDTLTRVVIGGPYSGDSGGPRCKVADAKLWKAALSQAQVEAEWDAPAPVVDADLICHAAFGGANISEALTSTTANQSGFETWVSEALNGTDTSDPQWSADNPAYAGPGVTLSGTVAMPAAEPVVGIHVKRAAIGSAEGAASVATTFSGELPAIGAPLIAFVGGWMDSATAIALSDNRGGLWEPLGLQKHPDTNIWLGAWRSVMPAGASATFAVTATPGAAGNWLTLQVLEIERAYSARLIDVPLTFASGTSQSPAADIANTLNSKTLVLAAVSYLSAANDATAGSGWTMVAKKDGYAALAVERRAPTTAGNYDPAFTLALADSWIACGLALVSDPPDDLGGIPPVLLRRR